MTKLGFAISIILVGYWRLCIKTRFGYFGWRGPNRNRWKGNKCFWRTKAEDIISKSCLSKRYLLFDGWSSISGKSFHIYRHFLLSFEIEKVLCIYGFYLVVFIYKRLILTLENIFSKKSLVQMDYLNEKQGS